MIGLLDMLPDMAPTNSAAEGGFDVETSYSGGRFWTYWNNYDAIEKARHEVSKLKASSPDNFAARIIRKEVVQ